MLLCASERGRDWGPRLAARLGSGLTGDAIGLELDGKDRLVALKPAFGGNIVAPILSKTYPQMATVRSGVLELAEPECSRAAPSRNRAAPTRPAAEPPDQARTRFSITTIVPLEGAEVVVGIGMGVGGPEGVERVKDFARTSAPRFARRAASPTRDGCRVNCRSV